MRPTSLPHAHLIPSLSNPNQPTPTKRAEYEGVPVPQHADASHRRGRPHLGAGVRGGDAPDHQAPAQGEADHAVQRNTDQEGWCTAAVHTRTKALRFY